MVWKDADNSGTINNSETGIANVTIKLYANDGTTLIATTTTGSDGRYLFNNLPEGDYIIGVDCGDTDLAGLESSADVASSTTPTSADNDDNGTTKVGTEIRTASISLDAGTACTAETDQAQTTGAGMGSPALKDNAGTPDNNSLLCVDFGFKCVAPDFTLTHPTVCPGDADFVNITGLLNVAAATGSLKVDAGTATTPIPSSITGASSGAHTATVINQYGCEATKNFTIAPTQAKVCVPVTITKVN